MELKPILLVEDNPDDETLTLRTLQKHRIPCEVTVAHDGVEALDYLFGTGPNAGRPPLSPLLVLLDLKLPKVDGLEVLRRVRNAPQTRLLPVVVFTSSNEAHDIAESYHLGANSYIRKPVDYSQFSEAVRLIGTYWLIENLPPHSGNSCMT
jgi:CheY-like chemotaxis protein